MKTKTINMVPTLISNYHVVVFVSNFICVTNMFIEYNLFIDV